MLNSLDATFSLPKEINRFEHLEIPTFSTKPSVDEPLTLELKPLPNHLRYAFLTSSSKLPVIISSDLTEVQEENLLWILRKYKRAIGWMIADIQGSPIFFLKILFLFLILFYLIIEVNA